MAKLKGNYDNLAKILKGNKGGIWNFRCFRSVQCRRLTRRFQLRLPVPPELVLPPYVLFDRVKMAAEAQDEGHRFFVAVHVGAGFHAPSNEKALRSAMKRACLAAAVVLRKVCFTLVLHKDRRIFNFHSMGIETITTKYVVFLIPFQCVERRRFVVRHVHRYIFIFNVLLECIELWRSSRG